MARGRLAFRSPQKVPSGVPVPRNRFYIPRIVRGISQRRPQFGHRLVQAAIKIHERVGWPELFPQLFAGDHFPRMFQKQRENLERLFLQLDSHAVLAKLDGLEIDFKSAKTPGSEGTLSRSHDYSPLQFSRA